jgi:pre-rRNA-processing protein TSR3
VTVPTIIVRHRKENLRKCSLRGLEGRPDLRFVTYPGGQLPSLDGYCLLAMEGEELTANDCDLGLVLLDGTWRYAERMAQQWRHRLPVVRRSLPHWVVTAYPRAQTGCPDGLRGLASVEALYLAHQLLGRSVDGLLNHYHWRDQFLEGVARRAPSIDGAVAWR